MTIVNSRNIGYEQDNNVIHREIVCEMFHFIQDEEGNDCNKGAGDDVESDEEFISVDFTCGSMVWVKFAGYTSKI